MSRSRSGMFGVRHYHYYEASLNGTVISLFGNVYIFNSGSDLQLNKSTLNPFDPGPLEGMK